MTRPLDRLAALTTVSQAQATLVKAALQLVLAADYGDDHDPHADDQVEYTCDTLALAARNLVGAIDALPAGERRPAGWPAAGGGR